MKKLTNGENKINLTISKSDFIKALDELMEAHDFQIRLNSYYKQFNCEGTIYFPDCTTTVVNLLHIIFEESDKEEWISFFVHDLDFGRKRICNSVKDKNGNCIQLQNKSDLYNLLTNNLEVSVKEQNI